MNKRVAKEKSLRDEDIISEEEFLARKADLYALYLDQIAELNKKTDEDILKAKLEAFMQGMDKVVGIGDQLLEAEVTREERKTVLMNNQLKEQLRNEGLSAKERENINKQIQSNEEALAKKRDELAEKQFKLNKAASIASALVNTFLAASDVLAREKGGLVTKTVAMAAVIAAGLAQVAAIARQQFVPSGISAGGGASGAGSGASIEAPDFNVVGASQTSQLAETVAGQQAKPIKAFVVGKDISTQQELDRNITNTASFG
jgi:flagellar biosynthesis chaperone FliJ